MATTLFTTNTDSVIVYGGYGGFAGANFSEKTCRLTRGTVATASFAVGTVAGVATGNPVDFWNATDGTAGGLIFISNPLNPVTVSGNITANVRGLENNAKANYGAGIEVRRLARDGSDIALVVKSAVTATEFGTIEAASNASIAVSSTVFAAGDRIAIFPWFYAAGGTTASGNTATGFFAGPTAGASGDTFVTFTESITEETIPTLPHPALIYQRKNR